jgi:hypothetical protein
MLFPMQTGKVLPVPNLMWLKSFLVDTETANQLLTWKAQFQDWWSSRRKAQKGIIFVIVVNMTVCYILGWLIWILMVGFLLSVIATLHKVANIIALPIVLACYICGPILFSVAYAEARDDWPISSRLAYFSGEFGAVALGILLSLWMAK